MAGFYEPRITNHEPRHFFRTLCGSAATNSRLSYDHVPFVINSGYAQNSRGLATCEPLRCGSAATNSLSYYNHVPLVINSGCTRDSRGLFGPSGADQRKAQGGCQNGQLWLDALWASPTVSQPGDKWKLCLLATKIHGQWPCA